MNVLSFLLNNLIIDKTIDVLLQNSTEVNKYHIDECLYKLGKANAVISKAFSLLPKESSNGINITDLASWSTVILYGITITLMIFTGIYYMTVENEDIFRWKNRNSIIAPFIFYNLAYCIIVVLDGIVAKNGSNWVSTSYILFSFIFLSIFSKNTSRRLAIYGIFSGLIYVVLELFLFENYTKSVVFFCIILNFSLTFIYIVLNKEKLYPLKEYIFYLTDQKCYLAKLESIKEGFFVLYDVKLYNSEISERSIDKLKPESFEIQTIINKFNEKIIIENNKMIIPKEQILSMYIVEKNEEESKKDKNQKIKKNSFILFLIIIIMLFFFLGQFINHYILKKNITIPILVSVILFSTGISLIKIKSSDYRRDIKDFIDKTKDSDYIDINEVIKGLWNIALNVVLILLAILIKVFSIPKLLNLILFINFFNVIYLILEIKKFVIIFVKKIIDYIKLNKSRIKNIIIILLVILLVVITILISFYI